MNELVDTSEGATGAAPDAEKPPLVEAAGKTVALQKRLRDNGPAIATWLAVGSIGVGIFGLLAPRAAARLTGSCTSPAWPLAAGNIALGTGLLLAADKQPWLKGLAACDALAAASAIRRVDHGPANHAAAALATTASSALAVLAVSVAMRMKIEAMHRRADAFDYSDRVGLGRPPNTLLGREVEG